MHPELTQGMSPLSHRSGGGSRDIQALVGAGSKACLLADPETMVRHDLDAEKVWQLAGELGNGFEVVRTVIQTGHDGQTEENGVAGGVHGAEIGEDSVVACPGVLPVPGVIGFLDVEEEKVGQRLDRKYHGCCGLSASLQAGV